jgi:hypothetical protein
MRLIRVTYALEHLDRVRHRGRGDRDRLKAACECRIRFDVRAVLVACRSSHKAQVATYQSRLEEGSAADRVANAALDDGAKLVDEQDNAERPSVREHVAEAFFGHAGSALPGEDRSEVQHVHLPVSEHHGHRVLGDRLGQALDDGGLADAGLPDQHRLVSDAAGEHLHDALDLLVPPDDRVEPAPAGGLGQVPAELLEDRRDDDLSSRESLGSGGLIAGEQLDDLLADAVEIGAQLHQDPGGDALALADQAEQEMLGADVAVAEPHGLALREHKRCLGLRREWNVPGRRPIAHAAHPLNPLPNYLKRYAQHLEDARGDAFTLTDKAEQKMLGVDVVAVVSLGFLLSQDNNPP